MANSRSADPKYLHRETVDTSQTGMKKRLIDLLKLAIGLGLLYFLYTKLEDPAKLWQQIQDSNKLLLLAATATYALAVAASALKWGILLRAIDIMVPSSRLLDLPVGGRVFQQLPAGRRGRRRHARLCAGQRYPSHCRRHGQRVDRPLHGPFCLHVVGRAGLDSHAAVGPPQRPTLYA